MHLKWNALHIKWDSLFKNLYRPAINRFIVAWLKHYMIEDFKEFRQVHAISIERTNGLELPHGITGVTTVRIFLPDQTIRGYDPGVNDQNCLVISHEFVHALAEFYEMDQRAVTQLLHQYHGENATKDLRELLTDFRYRYAWRWLMIPKYDTVRVIDFDKFIYALNGS